ncbi:MAG: class I SAM-dependent methyltransferase [Calditrichota bacterium]
MKSEISYQDYLAAKKEIDDAALNTNVLNCCYDELGKKENPEIVELGAGTGAMAERFLDAGAKFQSYTLVDELKENTQRSFKHLLDVLQKKQIPHRAEKLCITFGLNSGQREFRFATADCFNYLEDTSDKYDLLIACALIDLLPIRKTVKRFLGAVKPDGLFYFPINFDGETIFEPVTNPEREERLMREYHRTMDERVIKGAVSGDSKTGRKLFSLIPKLGGKILSGGASDWVVFPNGNRYQGDTDIFLRFILDTVRIALDAVEADDKSDLISWYAERLEQLEQRKLTYIAHQLDILGQLEP